jgi:hypothetical protein
MFTQWVFCRKRFKWVQKRLKCDKDEKNNVKEMVLYLEKKQQGEATPTT